jgi:hypothetical protein
LFVLQLFRADSLEIYVSNLFVNNKIVGLGVGILLVSALCPRLIYCGGWTN